MGAPMADHAKNHPFRRQGAHSTDRVEQIHTHGYRLRSTSYSKYSRVVHGPGGAIKELEELAVCVAAIRNIEIWFIFGSLNGFKL